MASSYAVAVNTFTHWPVDWTIIGAFAVIVALETLRSGANRACSVALALPLALLLFQILPSTAILGTAMQHLQTPLAQSGLLLALVVIGYFLVHRIVGFYADSSGAPVPSLITGAAAAILVLVFWLQVPALQSVWQFGPQIQLVFGETYRLWWLAGGYLALAFVRS